MRWEDERYVRVYTRDTVDWLGLSFLAQGLFCLLLRKVDRAGLVKLGKPGRRGVAIIVGHAGDWPRLEAALDELLADGCVEIRGEFLVVPNFIEAQEAVMSDRQRKAESRARARDLASAAEHFPDILSGNVTSGHVAGQKVTPGHATSRTVTPSLAVPSLAVPSQQQHAAAAPTRQEDEASHQPLAVEDLAPSDAPSRWPLLQPFREGLAARMAVPSDWFKIARPDRVAEVRNQLQAEVSRLGLARAVDVAAEAAARASPKPRWLAWFVGALQDAPLEPTRKPLATAPANPPEAFEKEGSPW